jgi:hypothetical protein
MDRFTNQEKVDMLYVFHRCQRNGSLSCNMYHELYPERRQPSRTTFGRLEKNLRVYGGFIKPRNRALTVAGNEENVQNVMDYVEHKNIENKGTSIRELEQECGVKRTSVRKILKTHKYRPYKIRKVHHLRVEDFQRRLQFCRWFFRTRRRTPDLCQKILWSDESHFSNNGWFNRNIHYQWRDENVRLVRETNFQERFGTSVWIGVLGTRVIGPYFFNGTQTQERYLTFMREQLPEYLDDIPLNEIRNFTYYQQDGAPAHNGRLCVQYLNEWMGDMWIGTNGPVRWPARSPDLTPLDTFVWAFIKDKVFASETTDLEHLKNKITHASSLLTPGMLRRVMRNTVRRLQLCRNNRGRHIEHLL